MCVSRLSIREKLYSTSSSCLYLQEGWCELLRTPVPVHAPGVGPMRRASSDGEGAVSRTSSEPSIPRMRVLPLPSEATEQASQAASAIEAAFQDGVHRQCVELFLQDESGSDDWPGGIRQQWRVAQPLVESILRVIKTADGLQGPLSADIWDQGDAVGAWSGKSLAAVLFPTADSMDQVWM